MPSPYRFLALSPHPAARAARAARHMVMNFSLPAPRVLVVPMLWVFLGLRTTYYFVKRVFICEPLFKASCTRYGRRLRTDVYIHWVSGSGQILLGDDVLIDGMCSFLFAARYSDQPTLEIGDSSGISHGCQFTVGKRITIGRRCQVAAGVWMFDSSGHPTDPQARAAGLPAPDGEVRPITIGDDVWIGTRSIIFPGVTLGSGSVISAGSVVMSDVPPLTIVAGNPARKIASIPTAPSPSAHPVGSNGRLAGSHP